MARRADTTLTVRAVATATKWVRRRTSARTDIVIGDPKAHLQVMVRAATPRKVRGACAETDHPEAMVRHEMATKAAAMRDRMARRVVMVHL
jgi:hypothetical protein